VNKDPTDEIMCNFIYNSLKKAHPEEISKIENNNIVDGWKKYWNEVLYSQVSYDSLILYDVLTNKIIMLTQ
jgi:hypothetical protein